MRTINRLFDDNDDDDYDDNCEKSVPGFVAYYHILSGTDEGSGGLTIVPIVPWHGAPRWKGPPTSLYFWRGGALTLLSWYIHNILQMKWSLWGGLARYQSFIKKNNRVLHYTD